MTKKIYLVLGDGFNEHFNLKTSYADFVKNCYECNNEFYEPLFNVNRKNNSYEVLRTIKSSGDNYNVWDCYFAYGLYGNDKKKKLKIDFKKMQWKSFDSRFWFEVLLRAVPGLGASTKECNFRQSHPDINIFSDSSVLDNGDAETLNYLKKADFFARLLRHKYSRIFEELKEKSAKENVYTFYECLYQELVGFEKDFGTFVEYNSRCSKNTTKQISFVDKIKKCIDPKDEYQLEILDFNFNTIGEDVFTKYQVEYLHGNFEDPILGLSIQSHKKNDDENAIPDGDNLLADEYIYVFSSLYQRMRKGLKRYCDIINKNDENILAFYGLSFSKYDCEEFYLLHEYQSKYHPIYLFYSNYDKKNPHLLGDYLYTLYSNFYVDYYNYVVMDQFYWLIEDGDIEIKEV